MAQVAPSKNIPKSPEEVYRLHEVEKMIETFMKVDKDKNGKLTKKELRECYASNKCDEKQIEDWMAKFDINDDGVISLSEFARGIGIPLADMEKERDLRLSEDNTVPVKIDNVEIIACTMAHLKAKQVIEKFIDLVENNVKDQKPGDAPSVGMNDVTTQLKSFLDDAYGRIWQCICLTGAYWMNFSHEPFMSLQFRYKDYVCLTWRTHRG